MIGFLQSQSGLEGPGAEVVALHVQARGGEWEAEV